MNIPSYWHEVDTQDLLDYIPLYEANIKIMGAFISQHKEVISPVIFYDYGHIGDDFINLYDQHLVTMAKINKFIDGDPNNSDYEDTATDKPVFHKHITNSLGSFYVVVIEHFLQEGLSSYTVQIFFKKENRLFACQTTLPSFNVSNSEMELCENKLILDIYKTLSQI